MTKTEQMVAQRANLEFEQRNDLTCPVDNQYQGNARRMLFVCSAGLLRSPTGAVVATKLGFNARSCGSSITYSLIPLSVNLVHWAKHIFFMNVGNFNEALLNFFGDRETCELIRSKAIVLEIEDDFEYMESGLIEQFKLILNDTKFVD